MKRDYISTTENNILNLNMIFPFAVQSNTHTRTCVDFNCLTVYIFLLNVYHTRVFKNLLQALTLQNYIFSLILCYVDMPLIFWKKTQINVLPIMSTMLLLLLLQSILFSSYIDISPLF
uniref:Uncharacterized protein n=1 Tax=Ditylum brightwellii TaxID=49249 RepID=A0A7S1YT49_9STRA